MSAEFTVSLNAILNARPIVVAVAGPNGAGKSTFYNTHLRPSGLEWVNADVLATVWKLDPYQAAHLADNIRRAMLERAESFIFETVFSDPEGDKLGFLKDAEANRSTVVLFFIGVASVEISERRVSTRVAQGGHDVPKAKLAQRFPRTLANLKAAIPSLEHVYVVDNSSLLRPFRLLAHFKRGKAIVIREPLPEWFKSVLPDGFLALAEG